MISAGDRGRVGTARAKRDHPQASIVRLGITLRLHQIHRRWRGWAKAYLRCERGECFDLAVPNERLEALREARSIRSSQANRETSPRAVPTVVRFNNTEPPHPPVPSRPVSRRAFRIEIRARGDEDSALLPREKTKIARFLDESNAVYLR